MGRKPVKRARPPRASLGQRLRGNFLTGLIVVLPVFLTIYLVYLVVGIVDARVIPLIPARYNPENVFGRNIFGLGLVIFLVFTTAVGALTKGYLGGRVIVQGERLVERMPIVRTIYNALKQIFETMLSQSGTSFQQACLIEYPRKGLWRIGFIATATRGEILAKAGQEEMVNVFVPSTPNPTAGFLFFALRREVVMLDMTIEDAAKLVISGGMVGPPDPRAEAARAPGPARGAVPAGAGTAP